MTTRDHLIKALRDRLVPAFAGRGFEVAPLLADEQKSREFRVAFPLGRLRRVRADGSFEMVEIQLDKRGISRFRLNFGVIPARGIDHPIKHVEQHEAVVGFLFYSGELYSWPLFMRWFSVPSRLSDDVAASKSIEVVNRVVALIPEVEDWLKSGKVGRHVRQVGKPPKNT